MADGSYLVDVRKSQLGRCRLGKQRRSTPEFFIDLVGDRFPLQKLRQPRNWLKLGDRVLPTFALIVQYVLPNTLLVIPGNLS